MRQQRTDDRPIRRASIRGTAIDSVTGKPLDLNRMHPSYVRWFERQQAAEAERERAEADREAQARKDALEAWFREHVDPLLNAPCREQKDRGLRRWAERVLGEGSSDGR